MNLSEILLDRDEGAAQLLARAVEWLAEHPEALEGARRAGTLRLLRETRPAMAAFARLAERLAQGASPLAVREEVRTADARAASRFAARVRERALGRLATLSWSSSVLRGLKTARNDVRELHVLESWPGGEGKRLFAAAKEFIPVTFLYPDEALADAVRGADAGVIGADTVFADGAVLNKVLSRALGEELRRQGKPLFVMALSWKRAAGPGAGYRVEGEDAHIFEVVPARLVTEIIDETG